MSIGCCWVTRVSPPPATNRARHSGADYACADLITRRVKRASLKEYVAQTSGQTLYIPYFRRLI